MPDRGKTQIRVVLTQKQAVFRTRRHHPVRFMVFFGNQIVDQDTDICLGTVEDDRFFSQHFARRIDTRHKALYRRFLITGASVKLTAAEQSPDRLKFQRCL